MNEISIRKEVQTMADRFWNEQWTRLKLGEFDNGVLYQISNYGRIKSYAYDDEGRILKGGVIQGYRTISFTHFKGARITRYVHKLVAEHFVEKRNGDERFVLHLDYDKMNNSYRNLKWATKEEKDAHVSTNPNYLASKGQVKYSKLTENQVVLIKKALKRNKNRLTMIAKRFGITRTQLNRIKKGENWGYIKV